MDTSATQAAIIRAAREEGIDPKYALAIAERESGFDPNAKASKTVRGVFQMTGANRARYGGDRADSTDAYDQAKAWAGFFKDVKREMAARIGRDPTDAEAYRGHYFGGVRAGNMMRIDPQTPVEAVFTPNEMAQNAPITRAGTIGALNSSVTQDIERRARRYADAGIDTGAKPGNMMRMADAAPRLPSEYGDLVDAPSIAPAQATTRLPSEYGDLVSEASGAPPASMPPGPPAGQASPPPPLGRDAQPAAALS